MINNSSFADIQDSKKESSSYVGLLGTVPSPLVAAVRTLTELQHKEFGRCDTNDLHYWTQMLAGTANERSKRGEKQLSEKTLFWNGELTGSDGEEQHPLVFSSSDDRCIRQLCKPS